MVAGSDPPRPDIWSPARWLTWLVARPGFQDLAARLPVSRALVRRDGAGIFDLLQGFVASQVLAALVELDLLRQLMDRPAAPLELAMTAQIPPDRMCALLRAGVALKLLKRRRDGRFALARKGAAILGVPGLQTMIRHNRAFYADMADPVGLLRGQGETELARFWPYVAGGSADLTEGVAERYSDLMARSQVLVAQDTLRMVSLRGVRQLLDVGGGSGVFLAAALRRHKRLKGILLDLPEVMPSAEAALQRAGLDQRVARVPGSFRSDALPEGADAIALVRVLYDHDDATVAALLRKAFAALPPGGRLIVSEPMSGGVRPDRAGDVYFAFYTMAMGTGQVRSAARIAAMARDAGFAVTRTPRPLRPYITGVVECVVPTGPV